MPALEEHLDNHLLGSEGPGICLAVPRKKEFGVVFQERRYYED
jgi:hypothetical protein